MARLPRQVVPGYPYHVIQRGHNRLAVFMDDADRLRYLDGLHEAAQMHGLDIHVYVLMDNHVHLLCTPAQEASLALTMQAVGRRYVRAFNRRHGRSGTLWEGRFRSSIIEADRYLLACQRYIELNPVRAGMVEQAVDWPWSSHRHYAGVAADARLRTHPTIFALGNTPFERESAYRQMFDETSLPPAAELAWLTRRALAGKPMATEVFQRGVESSHQVRLLPAPVGRPRRRPQI
jgi:putative transposase